LIATYCCQTYFQPEKIAAKPQIVSETFETESLKQQLILALENREQLIPELLLGIENSSRLIANHSDSSYFVFASCWLYWKPSRRVTHVSLHNNHREPFFVMGFCSNFLQLEVETNERNDIT